MAVWLSLSKKLVEVRKYAGMVFQGYNLYPHYNVLENIMVPQVDILKRSKQEAYDRAMEYLKMVDLANASKKKCPTSFQADKNSV